MSTVPKESLKSPDDPYKDEPTRNPLLIVHGAKPFNAEPPLDILERYYLTPNEVFFVRNHLPVPKIDPEKYRYLIPIYLF